MLARGLSRPESGVTPESLVIALRCRTGVSFSTGDDSGADRQEKAIKRIEVRLFEELEVVVVIYPVFFFF